MNTNVVSSDARFSFDYSAMWAKRYLIGCAGQCLKSTCVCVCVIKQEPEAEKSCRLFLRRSRESSSTSKYTQSDMMIFINNNNTVVYHREFYLDLLHSAAANNSRVA